MIYWLSTFVFTDKIAIPFPMAPKVLEKKQLFKKSLDERGLKTTSQRDDIADVFFRTTTHISLEEILRRVKKKNPKVGYATVYRTMKLLSECNLALERQFGDGQTRYEHLPYDRHHDHLICIKCGKILEFENNKIEELQATVAEKVGFTVTTHKMELYGYCSSCA